MLNIKKISPTEFRLHNKLFYVAYSPNNYFEAFRFEITFQYLLMWFFKELGMYFYIQKLKLIDDTILFQLYYYKTYKIEYTLELDDDLKRGGDAETYLYYPELFDTTLHFYNRNLVDFFFKRKSNKKSYAVKKRKVKKSTLWKKRTNYVRPQSSLQPKLQPEPIGKLSIEIGPSGKIEEVVTIDMEEVITKSGESVFIAKNRQRPKPRYKGKKYSFKKNSKRPWKNPKHFWKKNLKRSNKKNLKRSGKRPYTPRWLPRYKKNIKIVKKIKRNMPTIAFNFFFTYFFLYFFKYSSIILYKSLYKIVFTNQLYKAEHSKLLYKTRYLQKSKWFYDLYFFLNYALTFTNTTFLFPYFVYHLTKCRKQKRVIIHLFNLLRKIYFFKRTIRGIKILINGPYDRHGRSRHLVLKIGDISLIEYRSYIMYDSIQCLTGYGTINLKFWVHYIDANVNLNIDRVDVTVPRKTTKADILKIIIWILCIAHLY